MENIKKQTLYNPYKKSNGSKTDRGRSITDKIKEFRNKRKSSSKGLSSGSRPKTSRSFSKKSSQNIGSSSNLPSSRNVEKKILQEERRAQWIEDQLQPKMHFLVNLTQYPGLFLKESLGVKE